MKHRAPDGGGIFYDGKYCIGNGRLAIVDVGASDVAPFINDELVLAFNGEIYNYLDLRQELKSKGYSFKTNTDTEVLIKAYREWGPACLDKLNGMFAFVIYDGEQVFAARDIAGEKPLYYTEEPFRTASEAKALGFTCKELPPAHCLIYDFKRVEVKPWWVFKPVTITHAEPELEELLMSSIQLRTSTEVPYALYLSGGIDSTLISTFHDFDYTLTYDDGNFRNDFKKQFHNICWHLDYPIKSFSAYGLWKLAERAHKKGVKVVLSGEGADELFGGYIRYMPDALFEQAQKHFPSYKSMFPVKHTLNDWCWAEFNGNMRELLRMGDRMAAAWGIENRCPFLDRRIIEFAFSLPFNQKVKGFETKHILREILRKRKKGYQDIEKTGLYCSVNQWLGVDDPLDKSEYVRYQELMREQFGARDRSKE